jgi:hypothetical protein
MGKIINYKYLFILALLIKIIGFYPLKGLSNAIDSQDINYELASKYEELYSSIKHFSNNIDTPKEVENIRQKIQEIDNITKQLESQDLKVSNIQSILRNTSSAYIRPAEDGLNADEIKKIQNQLEIKETGSLDQETKNKIQERILQNLKLVKKDIDEIRIDLLEKEIQNLKAENNNTRNWVFNGFCLGMALVIFGVFLEILRLEFIQNKIKNFRKGKEPNQSTGNGNKLKYSTSTSGIANRGNSSVDILEAATQESASQTQAGNLGKGTIQEEEKTPTQTVNSLQATAQESDTHAQLGKQEESNGEGNNQKDTSTLLQHPPLSESNLVDRFNNHPKLLLQNAIEVSETSESIDNRRLGYNKPVTLEKVSRNKGIAWVINIDGFDYLVPKSKLKINEYNYETIESLFVCNGYQSGLFDQFKLLVPAKLASQGETWELREQGELRFN